jgi:UrcA family protein
MRIQSTILALAAAALAVPAIAADGAGSTVSVRYNDLNLATKAGQEELDRRLERAARNVCGLDAVRTGTRLPSAEARRCYREARATLDKQFASLVRYDARGG